MAIPNPRPEITINVAPLAGRAYQLVRYQVDDPLEDAALETAAVAGLTIEDARALVRTNLLHYHFKLIDEPAGIDRQLYHLVGNLTQHARLPIMTTRMNWVLEQLAPLDGVRAALDYGGGGGRDSIILAKLGYQTTYSDLIGPFTPWVEKRFRARGLDIRVADVRDLGEQRFDLINCMDVLEHIYDLEYAVADLFAHLRPGGHLITYPCFYNSWDGDHVEKNCGYRPYFLELVAQIGLRLVAREGEVYHLVREAPEQGTCAAERELARGELYRHSERLSFQAAMKAMSQMNNDFAVDTVSALIDNFGIWRLSRHRLAEKKATP